MHGTSTRRLRGPAAVVVAALLAAGACGGDEGLAGDAIDELTAPASLIDITITDSAFEVTGPVRPGGTIRFTADGDLAHYVQVRKVADSATLGEALAAVDDQAKLDGLAPEVSAPTIVITPGHAIEITDPGLATGDYLLLDFFPVEGDTEGRFHTDEGLVGQFTVAGDPAEPLQPTDTYTITRDSPISGAPTLDAGHHVLRVERSGHDFGFPTLFRLRAGMTLTDAITALNGIFDYEVWPIGSGRDMAEYLVASAYPPLDGDHVDIGVDLDPGAYVLVALGYDSDGFAFAGPEFIELTIP
jgi:hypothetical protein